MDYASTLAVGLIAGAVATWLVHRGELQYLREELKAAHAQIAHAVLQEGATIPPRIEEPEPLPPLSNALRDLVDQWESPESRAIEEAKIRQWQAEGYGEAAILRQYGASE